METWAQMLASFTDEMGKIANNAVYGQSSSNLIAKPASVSKGPRVATQMKAEVKPTSYSMVHAQQPEAALDTAAGSKMVPPPPVRA